MRRSIWSPVAFVLLVWTAAAVLPHAGALPRLVHGDFRLAPPSWPVPALRASPFPKFARLPDSFVPSWPPPALHVAATGGVGFPLAARLAGKGLAGNAATALAVLIAVAGLVLAGRSTLSLRRRPGARAVRSLARRGVSHSRIARQAGLARDAVRALLASPAPAGAGRRE